MTSIAEEFATQKIDYFVGTNSTPRHVAEAQRQGIVNANETLLGIFDGIFYEAGNKRIGGIALNDFLVITDHALTIWARDQYRDYVDRFPLSHTFVGERKQKDSLHGTLKLALVLPDVSVEELDGAERIEITFDFVPIADLELIAGLIDVLGSAHRDLIVGGAGEEDRYRASQVLFAQVFLSKFIKESAPTQTKPRQPGNIVTGPLSAPFDEPLVQIIDDDEAEAFMTPLSRLDSLESFNRAHPNSPSSRPAFAPDSRPSSRPLYNEAFDARESTRFYSAAPESNQGYYAGSSNGQASLIEQELRWLNNGTAPASRNRGARREQEREVTNNSTSSAPGARLRDELNNSEALYVLGRAGRAMLDNVEKLRREAESKSSNLVPFLSSIRDSGMNLRDLTEFLLAANDLLDTVGKNPAARELALMFASRAMGDVGKMKPQAPAKNKRGLEDEAPAAPVRSGARVKVERRKKDKPLVEVEDVPADEVLMQADLADAAEFTTLGSQTKIIDEPDAEVSPIVAPKQDESDSMLRYSGSQTKIVESQESFSLAASTAKRMDVSPPPKPGRHRLTIRSSNAGAADSGPGEETGHLKTETAVNFSAPSGPDLN